MTRLQAKFVVVSPDVILHPGQIVIQDNRIAEVAEGTPEKPDQDLGEVVLLPGLINAHTHLEFSDLTEPISAGENFPDWIGRVVAHRREMVESLSDTESEQRRVNALRQGWLEVSRSGTALVADIVSSPWQPGDLSETGALSTDFSTAERKAEILALPELLGLSTERLAPSLEWAEKLLVANGSAPPNFIGKVGQSPHAPYSLLWEDVVQYFGRIKEPCVTAMHVAESREELEWLESASGPFRENFERLGIPVDGPKPRLEEVLQFLARRKRALLVHGNYLTKTNMQMLSGNDQLSVVYCPRTHEHFSHEDYPLAELHAHGIRVVLGTDSRASNPDLRLWRELVKAREHHPGWSPRDAFAAITTEAAKALGCESAFGTLQVGRQAWINRFQADPAWTKANLLDRITASDVCIEPLIL